MTKKQPKLENDYERMIPEYHKGSIIYGEHLVRYACASELVKGKVVLDIASGSGYGTKFVSKTAKKVYGVDISKESIEYSKAYFNAENIEYLVGDGKNIPIEDNKVDAIVSFETVEHIENYEKFLEECKRVLKPDGLLILSTPNDLEFAEGNHFHLHEFTFKELKQLTEKYFKNNKSYFQGTWIYTALFDRISISSEKRSMVDTYNHAPLAPENYLYFLMLCSNREITETVTNKASIAEHWSVKTIQRKTELTENHISNIVDQLSSAKKYIEEQNKTINAKETHIKSLEEQLHKIKNNIFWKIAQKLNKVRPKIK